LYILHKHTRLATTLDADCVARELVRRPNFLCGRGGISKLLQLHAERGARGGQRLPVSPAPPTLGEVTPSDGRYYLAKLFTKEHFQRESAVLNHCLGKSRLNHYLSRSIAGEIEIFSVRDLATHMPVVTIEYRVSTKLVAQIKTNCNQLVRS